MRALKLIFFLLLTPLLFVCINCKENSSITPPENSLPDTTSHNFTFTSYTFGGSGGSSYFKDVAIINDNLAYATGQIFANDSLGQNQTYGVAVWNGTDWKLKQLYYTSSGNTFILSNIRGIQYISSSEIWFAAGSIFRWDGISSQTQLSLSRLTFTDPNASVEKLWGSSKNLYGVGNAGTIVHFDGLTWKKQESGTTVGLRDVWGSADGKTVWASGESNDGSHSILLQYENNQWRTLWQRDGVTAVSPYGYNVGSVWNKNQTTFLSTSNGVFTLKDTISAKMKNNFSEYSRNLRGNSEYDMLTTGEGGRMWHYNGVDWKLLLENQNYFIIGGHIKNNIAIAVGTDFSVGFGSGLIYLGKR